MAKRRRFSGKKKGEILRRHLLEGEPVSDVCEECDLNPSQFYGWQKKFFEQGDAIRQLHYTVEFAVARVSAAGYWEGKRNSY